MNVRIERLESSFVKEISYILMEEIKDEDIKFVTITDCEITNDLSFAKVYFTDNTWTTVRFSGTEPILRIMAEVNAGENEQGVCLPWLKLIGLED